MMSFVSFLRSFSTCAVSAAVVALLVSIYTAGVFRVVYSFETKPADISGSGSPLLRASRMTAEDTRLSRYLTLLSFPTASLKRSRCGDLGTMLSRLVLIVE
jgi:hypothetical protein